MHSLAMVLGQAALVLKEFQVSGEGPEYVHIKARKAGLFAWILTALGVDVTTDFRVYADRIEFQEASLSGRIQTVMPLSAISIAMTGYTKPFGWLASAIIILGFLLYLSIGINSIIPGIIGIILFLALILLYFIRKTLMINVVSNSSWPILICFKRSIIEGVNIDYEQAQIVIDIINQLLMQQTRK